MSPAASGSQIFKVPIRCGRQSASEIFELSCREREVHVGLHIFGGVNANPE